MADGTAAFDLITHEVEGNVNVGTGASSTVELLAHTLEAYGGEAGPALLTHELTGTIYSGGGATGELTLLGHSLTGQILNGSAASASFALLAHSLDASMAATAAFDLPVHTLEGTILNGGIASGEPVLLVHEIEAEAAASVTASAAHDLLAHTVTGTIVSGSVASAAFDLLTHAVSTGALPGGVASGSFDLLVHELTAAGGANAVFSGGVLTLPAHTLTGQIISAISAAAEVDIDDEDDSALAMNLATGAITTYRKFRFNSFAKLADGTVLAAKDDGLYALGGTLDDAAAIEWIVKLPISDLGHPGMKRAPGVYVNYRSSGPIEFRVHPDGADWNAYILDETRGSGLYRNRVKLGKGMLAGNYQFEMRGEADFELSDLEFDISSYEARRA